SSDIFIYFVGIHSKRETRWNEQNEANPPPAHILDSFVMCHRTEVVGIMWKLNALWHTMTDNLKLCFRSSSHCFEQTRPVKPRVRQMSKITDDLSFISFVSRLWIS